MLNEIFKVAKKDTNYDFALSIIEKKAKYDLKKQGQLRKRKVKNGKRNSKN